MKHKTLKRHRRKRNQRGGQPGLLSALATTARMARSRLPAIRFPHVSLPRFASTATSSPLAPPPLEFDPFWATNGSKVPEGALSSLTTDQLQKIIKGQQGTYPSGTRREKLVNIARTLLSSKGLLKPSAPVTATPVTATPGVSGSSLPDSLTSLTPAQIENLRQWVAKEMNKPIEIDETAIEPTTGKPLGEANRPLVTMVTIMTEKVAPLQINLHAQVAETNRVIEANPRPEPIPGETYYTPEEISTIVPNVVVNFFTKAGQFKSFLESGDKLTQFKSFLAESRNKIPNVNLQRLDPSYRKLLALSNSISALTPNNVQYLKTRNLEFEPSNQTSFTTDISALLTYIFKHTPKDNIERILSAVTPNKIRDFRQSVFALYIRNPKLAKKVIDTLFSNILPANQFNPLLLDGIIATLKLSPTEIESYLDTQVKSIQSTVLKHEQETLLAMAKGEGWFYAQMKYRMIFYGLGAVIVFGFIYMGVYDSHSLYRAVHWINPKTGMTELEYYIKDFTTKVTESEVGTLFKAVTHRIELEIANSQSLSDYRSQAQQVYTEFTAPVRPKSFTEQIIEHFSVIKHSITSMFNSVSPPEEPPPMNTVRPRSGRNELA